ncbi:Exosome complex component Rrp42 [Schistosoma japonicum]|nr:Exosome complex component Rrp42 [Schistosoma japonicum]
MIPYYSLKSDSEKPTGYIVVTYSFLIFTFSIVAGELQQHFRMGDLNLLKPYAVFEQFFERKIRLEERDCLEFAEIDVTADVLTSCHGSALVKVGRTQVIAGVKVKVIPENGNSGSIICNVEFAGLCHRGSRLNASQPKYAQWLSSTIQRLLNNFAFPSVESQLNIFSLNDSDMSTPVASYCLKLDLFVLHDDGCLLDACVPAALVSLCTTKWTTLFAVTDEQAAGSYLDLYKPGPLKEIKSLKANGWPISLSFCFVPRPVSGRKRTIPIIAQPTRRELDIWDTDAGPVHVTISGDDIIDLTVINAFLTGLWDTLIVQNKNESDVVNVWNVLLDSAVSQAQKVLQKIQKTIN